MATLVLPLAWMISIVLFSAGAIIETKKPGSSYSGVLGFIGGIGFIVTTLVGLWQAWAPWEIIIR